MQDELSHFFRCAEAGRAWVFEVAVVRWDGPHTPRLEWKPFRRWKRKPAEQQMARARSAALGRPSLFRRCTVCEMNRNAGHMHDRTVCQGCAERRLGVVY